MSQAMQQIEVQVQGRAGNWSTVMVVQNLPQNITTALRTVARANPGCRVRAVDGAGRLVDLI